MPPKVHTYWLRYRGTRFPVRRGEYVLGRSPYCSIVVSNALASRQHCTIQLTSDGLTVVDLSSRNGTTVNGEKLEGRRTLEAGDIVRIGSDAIEVLSTDTGMQATGPQQVASPSQDTQPRLGGCIPSLDALRSLASAFDDDSSTVTDQDTIRLMTELVEATDVLPNRQEKVIMLQTSIGAVVQARLQRGQWFEGRDVDRLRQAISTMAGWFPDGRLDRWSADLNQALGPRS